MITRTIRTTVSVTVAVALSMLSTPVAAQTLAFERQSDISLTDAPRALAVADVTGDGWPDPHPGGNGAWLRHGHPEPRG